MKAFLKSPILTFLIAFAIILPACTSTDDTPGPGGTGTELSLANIVGLWGIQSTTEDGGTAETLVPCNNTIEIQPNGNFAVVDSEEGEWFEGNAAFDETDSTLTLTFKGVSQEFKLLSVSDAGFELQFNENVGGTFVVGVDQFVKLEDSDCASITSSALQAKWSIEEFERKGYEIVEGDRGDLLGTDLFDNIPYNRFTVEFRSDGSFVMIDLVNEFEYGLGTYRNLDDHNFVITIEEDDGTTEETLVHLTANTDNTNLSFTISDLSEDNTGEEIRVITEFDMMKNNGSEPTVTEESLEGKWSATSIAERIFLDNQLVDEEVHDQIDHNKLTLQFFDDAGVQMIDLVDQVGYDRGEWMFLDGSNILLNLGNDEGEDGYELFHITAAADGEFTMKSFDVADNRGGDGSGGGTANDGHEMEYDMKEFEVSLSKNSGDEPSVNDDVLIGMWEVTAVENLDNQAGGDGEGPQVGMVLTFVNGGSGEVTLQGNTVTTFEYALLDANNLKVIFADSDGGEANDGEEPENFTIFHVVSNQNGTLEVILYEPGRGNDGGDGTGGDGTGGDGTGGDLEDNGGPTYRVTIQKQG